MGSVNVIAVAQDELFTVNPDVAAPPERTTSNEGEPQADPASSPLAVRMRPRSLAEVVGQQHLLREGAPLRRLVEGAAPASVLLYGPPGTGKTTLANLVSIATGRRFVAMSALSAGVKEVRGVIEEARRHKIEWVHVDYEPHLRPFYEACGFSGTDAGLLRLQV